jgi:hypothetical protein
LKTNLLLLAALATLGCTSVATALPACGTLPLPDQIPGPDAASGRWESCKVRVAPGCEFGAYQATFWRQACQSASGVDFDIYIAFTWIEGEPLLPGQPDANGAYRGLPYVASITNFTLIAARTVVRLADGRTTTDLSESETAGYFSFTGIVDRTWVEGGGVHIMPGYAPYKFCPSSTTEDFWNGVSGGINANPIILEERSIFTDGFEIQ